MSKKGSGKNNKRIPKLNKRASLLKTLYGGEDGEAAKENSKPSTFSFLNKIPSDFKASNGADTENDPTSSISVKSDKSDKSDKSNSILSVLSSLSPVASPSEASSPPSSSSTEEAPTSTWWFVFRVIVVLIVVLVFALNLTGYLDNLVKWFTNTFGSYINPILVYIGLKESTPKTNPAATGTDSGTGTNSVDQLQQNIGTTPVQPTPTPTQSETETSVYKRHKIDNIKPIPIQPNQRKTPLQNKGESALPPGTQPAQYQEETSREKEKQASIKQALDYAESHQQQPTPDDSTSSTQFPKTKSGYCFIGEDRGFRSCIQVSESTKCMSGDIFPSMDVCVNPSLRV